MASVCEDHDFRSVVLGRADGVNECVRGRSISNSFGSSLSPDSFILMVQVQFTRSRDIPPLLSPFIRFSFCLSFFESRASAVTLGPIIAVRSLCPRDPPEL